MRIKLTLNRDVATAKIAMAVSSAFKATCSVGYADVGSEFGEDMRGQAADNNFVDPTPENMHRCDLYIWSYFGAALYASRGLLHFRYVHSSEECHTYRDEYLSAYQAFNTHGTFDEQGDHWLSRIRDQELGNDDGTYVQKPVFVAAVVSEDKMLEPTEDHPWPVF